MDNTVYKVALAGLMHDIGKFAQGSLPVTKEYLNNNAGLYQPYRNNHYTHIHAVYTAAFIESQSNVLPIRLNEGPWGDGDSFINLAAGHHNPETAMQWIISMADRISSGLDRDVFEEGEKIAYRDVKKTRLLPILESMGPGRCKQFDGADKFHHTYALEPLNAKSIFPRERVAIEKVEAEVEYRKLFDTFCDRLGGLYHRNSGIGLWMEHFDSLLMTYTSLIPAARVGDVVHDVSLYDHSRTTAALASALYRYHEGRGSLDEGSIRRTDEGKFILVGGDFYGIQEFIFGGRGESGKFRSKLLRGRSFAVSLLTELALRLLCERLDLTPLSVLLHAAGKFHLLAPNLPETMGILGECETLINDWLFEQTYGESSLGLIGTPARPEEFHAGRFRGLWDRHLQALDWRKYRKVDLDRHGGVVDGYLDSFCNDLRPHQLCPICGKRPSSRETQGDTVFQPDAIVSCKLCRDHIYLGGNLVKDRYVAVCSPKSDLKEKLLAPIFDAYQVSFTGNPLDELAESGELLGLWQTDVQPDGTLDCRATVKLINGHVPCYRPEDNQDACLLESGRSEGRTDEMIDQIKNGNIKTFSHIAVKGRHMESDGKCHGIEALGVLKADVDNLGMLFGCGLSDNRFTISRLATVSRQLNSFFALYVPHALQGSFYDVYTVFAGGDDLFLIGPWNRMADLARTVRERFAAFVCRNPVVTLSAGISVHKPNTPIDIMAEAAEGALQQAKLGGGNPEVEKKKDRVALFGHSVTWEDFHELLEQRDEMRRWLEAEYIGDAMFYRFNKFVEMAEAERGLSGRNRITLEEISCVKWPALFRYGLVRNINKKGEERERAMEAVGRAAAWIGRYRGAMRIPLWHVQYEKRR